MSLFVAWAAKTTTVNYLGIAVNVPTELLANGYISMDIDGTIWAYQDKPRQDNQYWAAPSNVSDGRFMGLQILEISSFNQAIPELGESDHIAEGIWKNSLVKLSDCPVIVF